MKGNYCIEKALSEHKNHPITSDRDFSEIASKATAAINDGLFEHHVCFAYMGGNKVYYRTYFGKGWHKRKVNKEGWIKYGTALAYNIHTGEYTSRRSIKW